MKLRMVVANVQHLSNAGGADEQRVTLNPVVSAPENVPFANASLSVFVKDAASFNQLLPGAQYLVEITEAIPIPAKVGQ